MVIDEKQPLQHDMKDYRKPGAKLKLELLHKLEPPDPLDIPRSVNNSTAKNCFTEERIMASHIPTTGLNTSTKAMISSSDMMFSQLPIEIAMEVKYPRQDEAIHWELPDLRRSVLPLE